MALDALLDTEELRDSARRVLAEQIDRQALLAHAREAAPPDRALWKLMAELGWLGLAVPEERGGLGQPLAVVAVLYDELGRALSREPFVGAVVGLEALCHPAVSGSAAAVVEAGVAGEAVVVPALDPGGLLVCRTEGATRVVDGVLRNVLDAPHATHLVLPVAGEAPFIALVALPHPGVVVTHRPTWDLSRDIADIEFRGLALTDAEIVLRDEAAVQALARMQTHFDLALACDALGGASAAFEETLAYMHQRQQFNRPIASFQALKHRCADHKVGIEASRALLRAACHTADADPATSLEKAARARLHAGAVYRTLTEDCVQLHGGVGFTWEYPCHLFLKRARLGEVLGGTTEQRKDRVAPVLFRASRAMRGPVNV